MQNCFVEEQVQMWRGECLCFTVKLEQMKINYT